METRVDKPIRIGLTGNPNSGKTSIFNALTGARHHVGNYPGVTVEKREGTCRHRGRAMRVADLPGIYSLSAESVEELVARNYLMEEKPDVVVDVLDASNLERNLYLATQLVELGVPLVLAFNMSDLARTRGIHIDLDRISKRLGVPAVATVGHRGEGIEKLLDTVLSVAQGRSGGRRAVVRYGAELEEEIAALEALIAKHNGQFSDFHRRWLAVKLLENDEDVRRKVELRDVRELAERRVAHLERMHEDSTEVLIADRRYDFIADLCGDTVRFSDEDKSTLSDKIDAVVTNRFLALPIFLGLMYLVFHFTFTLGNPLTGWIETLFTWIGGSLVTLWPGAMNGPLESLLVDGVIGGVGGVIVFLPNILFLFLAISLLEDSGYMARAAFIMDRLMRQVGLHGKSFIPMLIGFGCAVPAIMATRTLDNRRDRLTTMLIIPLMSCSARLTIYALIIPAFFPLAWQAPMLWLIYVIGIVLAIVGANVLRASVFRGESTTFVMEMPPYRLPTVKSVLVHMWERAWLYLKKAGTIILGFSIVLWFMSTFPKKNTYDVDYAAQLAQAEAVHADDASGLEERLREIHSARRAEELAHSVAGRLGHKLEPVLAPMGFDWKIGTALIGAFAAKEVFVAQMGIVYAIGHAGDEPDALRRQLQANYTPLVGFCIMLFALIGAPCMATIAITKRESNSWKWAMFQLAGLTIMAYVLTVVAFQLGSLLGLGV